MNSNVDGKQKKVVVPLNLVCDAIEMADDEWTHLLTVPSNATITDNYAHIFMAENCCKSGGQNLDETEFVNIRKYSAD